MISETKTYDPFISPYECGYSEEWYYGYNYIELFADTNMDEIWQNEND